MTLRYAILIGAMVLGVHARDIWRVAGASRVVEGDNVILVVADGLRWQEVFRGADSLLLFADARAGTAQRKYWRPAIAERRHALMPFLWSGFARHGQLLGNRDVGSAAVVTNPMKFSYPGYNEMLVGYPDARIDRNEYGPNPNVTVFEWVNGRAGFKGRVAAFGMWSTFQDIFNVRRSGLLVSDHGTDVATHLAAMRHLVREQPRALFIGFGATDDLAHKGRYDLTLDAAHAIDGYVAELWSRLQSMPRYRGKTTLILVADHGRGRTPSDWKDHGKDTPGSDEMWFAVIGPHTPALGEQRDAKPVTLSQTAATVAAAVGLDYRRAVPRAAPVLPAYRRSVSSSR